MPAAEKHCAVYDGRVAVISGELPERPQSDPGFLSRHGNRSSIPETAEADAVALSESTSVSEACSVSRSRLPLCPFAEFGRRFSDCLYGTDLAQGIWTLSIVQQHMVVSTGTGLGVGRLVGIFEFFEKSLQRKCRELREENRRESCACADERARQLILTLPGPDFRVFRITKA